MFKDQPFVVMYMLARLTNKKTVYVSMAEFLY